MKKTIPNPKSPSKASKETLVTFILDKSGSMSSVAQATISGFNEYVDTLRGDKKSKYAMSLTLFDTTVEKVYANEEIKDVPELSSTNYRPGGGTALYDAAVQTIKETEKSLKTGQKVLCVIMTDGQENSSKEFTDKDLKEAMARLEKKGNWTFVFLGANQDSYAVAQQFGLSAQNVSNYNSSDIGTRGTFSKMATNTTMYAASASLNTQSFFSKEDQQDLENTK